MILLAHMMFGAALGYTVFNTTHNIVLAVIAALLGHYFLDLFPHVEYSVTHIKGKVWKKSFSDFVKVFFDFLLGLLLIFIFSKNDPKIYLYAFITLIPDGLTIISSIFPNPPMELHDEFHNKRVHFLKYKKISNFWRILTQVLAVIISILLLRS